MRRSAGARLIVVFEGGISYPLFLSADRARSRLSRTAASGKPTVMKCASSDLIGDTIDLDLKQVGVDAVNRGTDGLVQHRENMPSEE